MSSTSFSSGAGNAGRHRADPGGVPPVLHPLAAGLLKSKLFRYFVFGSAAALSQLIMLAALVETTGMDKAVASVSSFYLAVIVNYCLQKRYTFNSSESDWTALPKFLAVSTLGACINIAIFVSLLQFVHYLIAQCVALLLVFMFNYSISRMFIFRKQRSTAP